MLSPIKLPAKAPTEPAPGFLGRAVGSLHEKSMIKFWKETFEKDFYVENILNHGYKIPIKMTPEEAATPYRERNKNSA
jgi:hypothetical protein